MGEQSSIQSHDLIAPIYLDTYILLDLIASIENGFSTVEKITTKTASSETSDTSKRSFYAEITVPSFLKLGANPAKKVSVTDGTDNVLESDRYQTYGSLLYRLRNFLQRQNLLIGLTRASGNPLSHIQPSDFVEIRGTFHRNPFIASLDSIDRLMEIYKAAIDIESASNPKTGSSKKAVQDPAQQGVERLRKFTNALRLDMEREGVSTFVVRMVGDTSCQAVVTLFSQYLRDSTTSELVGKQFTLFGKVIQNFDKPDEAINLLSNTGFGSLSDDIINSFLGVFDQLAEQGLKLPKIITKVQSPALQVVPIAIYV